MGVAKINGPPANVAPIELKINWTLATDNPINDEGRQPSGADYSSYIVSMIQNCKSSFIFTVAMQPTTEAAILAVNTKF
jgi:hypothetical protein